jgi:hypothetical protein
MNSLIQNYEIILQALTATCADIPCFHQIREPFDYTEQLRRRLCGKFASLSNLFIADSTPVEICKTIRAERSTICASETIRPAFGYCAMARTRYFSYKLHAVYDRTP